MSAPGLKIIGTTTEEMLDKRTRKEPNLPPEPEAPRPPPSPPADKPFDARMGKMEIARAFALIFNIISRVIHDPVRYVPGDFQEEAEGVIDLVGHYARLRILLRLVGPLAAVSAAYEKVEGMVTRARERKAQAKAAATEPTPSTPTEVVESASGNRPAFR